MKGEEKSKSECYSYGGWLACCTLDAGGVIREQMGCTVVQLDVMYVRGIELVMISLHAESLDVMGGPLRACVTLQDHLNYSYGAAFKV